MEVTLIMVCNLFLLLQNHIRVLESTPENAALIMGLDYLINISYVDDTEVFKVLHVPYRVKIPLFWGEYGLLSINCFCYFMYLFAGLLGLLELLSFGAF